ncbi:MAG: rod-binding protein [Rhizobiaceae bacterium]
MSISPPSDIVLDVIDAVDPASALQARDRLVNASRSVGESTQTGAFPQVVDEIVNVLEKPGPKTVPSQDVRVKFEGMVLQTFIESILPKDTDSAFGSGLAGEMWRSMLSEKIANVVAEHGGVGIANRILADYVINGDRIEPVAGANDLDLLVQGAHAEDHAAALIHNKQRKFVELISGWQLNNEGEDARS